MYLPKDVLQARRGTSTRQEILQYSTARLITASVNDGSIIRLRRGIYGLPELPDAMSMAQETSGVISHDDAALLWKFEVATRSDAVHVTVPLNSNAKLRPNVRLHRRSLASSDIFSLVPGLRITTPLRTVLDCASIMPFRDGLTVADSALCSGLVSRETLLRAAAAFQGHGAANVRRVAKHADGKAANALETALRAICIEHRLGKFIPQLPVKDDGVSYRLDLADEAKMIDLEADGYAYHGHRKALHYDRTRNCELARRGWLVLRFSWEHIMLEPEWVAGVVRDTLKRRRVRPGRKNHRMSDFVHRDPAFSCLDERHVE